MIEDENRFEEQIVIMKQIEKIGGGIALATIKILFVFDEKEIRIKRAKG